MHDIGPFAHLAVKAMAEQERHIGLIIDHQDAGAHAPRVLWLATDVAGGW